jgi:hypothetical protein
MFIFRSGIVQTLFNVKNIWIRVQTPLLNLTSIMGQKMILINLNQISQIDISSWFIIWQIWLMKYNLFSNLKFL